MFPESSPFFLFLLFSFLTVFNTQCCFLAVRFLSHKPVLRWTRVVRRPRVVDSFFFSEFCLYVCFWEAEWWATSAVCHVSSWGENRGVWVVAGLAIPMCPDERSSIIPVANLFLLRESLYPLPWSSISIPDRVVPSFKNCTARVEGFEGPFESSNLALSVPAPGDKHGRWGKIKNELLLFLTNNNKTPTCLRFQTFLRCRLTSTNIYSALNSCNKRGGNLSLLLLQCSRMTSSVQFLSSSSASHQMEGGRDCMLVTPPSTGTKICTLVSVPGFAMDSGL